jgi:diguanylate cyclase (GGDEF)-like protein
MGQGTHHRLRARVSAPSAWPVWQLPSWLATYIFVLVTVYAGVVAYAAIMGTYSAFDLEVFGLMLACGAVTVELSRRVGENVGLISDLYAVWELPIAILLPPVFALTAPLLRIGLSQVRIRKLPVHRRVFTAAAVGLSYGAASMAFHSVGSGLGVAPRPGFHGFLWVLVVAVAALAQWATNLGLVIPAIKGSDPATPIREALLTREVMQNDVMELSVAILVTFVVAISPLTVLFALPFVSLLQRSNRHAQLLNASRIDSKTGLLNAGTWEREAAAEVARAVRTRTPVAVALLDIDHFKAVNDLHGHLIGDQALGAVARTFKIFVREYDLVGRFGGEEFALLFPQTAAADSYRIAERIRNHIAQTPIVVEGLGSEPVRLTVSMGVAALGSSWDWATGGQITDLVAAADRALYQAKQGGRDQVRMITDLGVPALRVGPGPDLVSDVVG